MTKLMMRKDDDRVVPLHSFKHAAVLQHAAPGNPHPLLIRIDRKAGHGGGKSTSKRYEYIYIDPSLLLILVTAGFKMQSPDGVLWFTPWV